MKLLLAEETKKKCLETKTQSLYACLELVNKNFSLYGLNTEYRYYDKHINRSSMCVNLGYINFGFIFIFENLTIF